MFGLVRKLIFLAIVLPILLVGGGIWLWWTLPDVATLEKKNPKTTAFIELRREEASEAGKKFALQWSWRPIGRISPLLRHAVIHAEDGNFWKHEGVDWDATKQAFERNWEDKRFSVGGSTITQQLAKNLYLSPSRNPVRKLREYFIAKRLEEQLSKRRILELYLNVAEWGPHVFGAEAASKHWFGKPASQLTAVEAARLAVALPNPFRRSPKVKSKTLDKKAARLVRAMRRDELITPEEEAAALASLEPPKPT